jgi:hypothetical protein
LIISSLAVARQVLKAHLGLVTVRAVARVVITREAKALQLLRLTHLQWAQVVQVQRVPIARQMEAQPLHSV